MDLFGKVWESYYPGQSPSLSDEKWIEKVVGVIKDSMMMISAGMQIALNIPLEMREKIDNFLKNTKEMFDSPTFTEA
jgi:hypothetical protein